jgi:hypothetical protein
MALCGFNKKMLSAEQDFADGLWDQLVKRSKEESLSIVDTLKLEIDEMDQFENDLRSLEDVQRVEDVIGIVYFARALYRNCFNNGGSKEVYDVYAKNLFNVNLKWISIIMGHLGLVLVQ